MPIGSLISTKQRRSSKPGDRNTMRVVLTDLSEKGHQASLLAKTSGRLTLGLVQKYWVCQRGVTLTHYLVQKIGLVTSLHTIRTRKSI
jgi:hypothetical protein